MREEEEEEEEEGGVIANTTPMQKRKRGRGREKEGEGGGDCHSTVYTHSSCNSLRWTNMCVTEEVLCVCVILGQGVCSQRPLENKISSAV